MCAWKRGTQNNQAGAIRKGQVKEYLAPSNKDISVSGKFKIISPDDALKPDKVKCLFHNSTTALICTNEHGFPSSLIPFLSPNGSIYLHSHEHPRCILTAYQHEDVPPGAIILSDFQRVNSKVCIGEIEDWTVYQVEKIKYDNREGAIGNTELRIKNVITPLVSKLIVDLRPRVTKNESTTIVNATIASNMIAKIFFGSIATIEEIFVIEIDRDEFVGRIISLSCEDDDIEEEDDFVLPDHYRGVVDASTEVFITSECPSDVLLIEGIVKIPEALPLKNVVYIITSDYEVFPVKRRLLRPCITLTSVVQEGKGIYRDSAASSGIYMSNESKHLLADRIDSDYINEDLVPVNVESCTFDRVLLYLEHEARNEEFKFDPLIVVELREAAITLGVSGLLEACDRVLGSFQERVRRVPIRLQEVIARNNAGNAVTNGGSRKETLLLMNGMVLDITRWLDEHPGGSSIIPEQALNIDSTVFFEIYHASRQSFLYLKEFYIGELAEEDIAPLPDKCPAGTTASDAFLEQLRRLTPWRLKKEELKIYENYKSF